MPTLLLRLSGPLQSWGVDSKIDTRRTSDHPTKSGVIGMIAAAMGRPRGAPLDDLVDLRFGVRTDQEGTLMSDFHTAHHPDYVVRKYVTTRYYLQDAVFVAGLEGDRSILEEIESALRSPFFPLFLGRRSCPVTGRVVLGIRDDDLVDALRDEPWQAADWYKRKNPSSLELEMTVETEGDGYLIRDSPISFSQSNRCHGFRKVATSGTGKFIDNPLSRAKERPTEHDAFKDMEVRSCSYRGLNSTSIGRRP